MNQQISEYINSAPEEQRQIMLVIRELIYNVLPNVSEEFKWNRPVFSLNKDFAYLKTAKNHVTLGFNNASKLADRDNRLEGTGKDMKHVKLRSLSDIEEELFKKWIMSAAL